MVWIESFSTKYKEPNLAYYLLKAGQRRDSCLSKVHKIEVKHKQPHPRFELESPSSFKTMITITQWASTNWSNAVRIYHKIHEISWKGPEANTSDNRIWMAMISNSNTAIITYLLVRRLQYVKCNTTFYKEAGKPDKSSVKAVNVPSKASQRSSNFKNSSWASILDNDVDFNVGLSKRNKHLINTL